MPDQPAARSARFSFPADLEPMWHRRLPELACAANALSLLMPHVEPYVVRVTRAAVPLLEPSLRTQTEHYLRQESSHHREHRRFNRIVADRYRGVETLERMMGACYRWLERRGSLGFGLAYASGFETIAFASARWVDHRLPRLFDQADTAVSRLFLWHLAEEVEHKSVAFDVRRAVGTSPAVQAAGLIVALVLMAIFTVAGTVVLLAGERRLWRPIVWCRLVGWAVSFAFEVLPMMAVSLLPSHHPSQLVDPSWFGLELARLAPLGSEAVS
jgi:predicted metal-dependent hydrolase